MGLALVRLLVVAGSALAGAAAAPGLGLPAVPAAAAAAAAAGVAVALEVAAVRPRPEALAWTLGGGLGGLAAGALAGAALAPLLGPPGDLARGLLALLGAYVGAVVAFRRRGDLAGARGRPPAARAAAAGSDIVVDTSAIIDARIADVCAAGFLGGTLVVPRFVLRELQRVADSGDPVRRGRGRRGFEALERLRAMPAVTIEMTDDDVADVAEVDLKLVEVARARGARLLTTDHALNRVAGLGGLTVLNVNELANALKPAMVPGETMGVQVLREGKEPGQGVGFLDDGTMVVVEGGKRFIGQAVEVVVTTALQTSAGRMIFTRPRAEEPRDA